MTSDLPSVPDSALSGAMTGALCEVLGPLARLAVARGVSHAALDDLLKLALVDAADALHADLPPHRRVSRISTATGIHRREVSRQIGVLRDGRARQVPAGRSQASELFAHWRTDPAYGDRRGSPAELPRQGQAPSFESLAHSITRDVHPRSLLDELLRLGLAAHDSVRDTVRLVREDFVPQGDEGRMLGVLGRNVGSHLRSAVDNLLQDGEPRHFEQALFADGLSEASMVAFRAQVRAQWQTLLAGMVPALEAMVARDAAAAADAAGGSDAARRPMSATHTATPVPATARHQLRLGIYTFETAMPPAAQTDTDPDPSP